MEDGREVSIIDIAPHKTYAGYWERWMLMSDGSLRKKFYIPTKGDTVLFVDTTDFTFSQEPPQLAVGSRKIVRMSQYDNDLWFCFNGGTVLGLRYNPLFWKYETYEVDLDSIANSPLREGYGNEYNVSGRYKSRLTIVEPDTTSSQPVNPECGAG